MKRPGVTRIHMAILLIIPCLVMGQIEGLCFHEVEPVRYVNVELCRIEIPGDLEACIRYMVEEPACNVIKKDSSEKFVVFLSTQYNGEVFESSKGFDACKEWWCKILIYLTDIEKIGFLEDTRKFQWDVVGYFTINGDTFYVEDSRDPTPIIDIFFPCEDEEEKLNLRMVEKLYFRGTEECTWMNIPVIEDYKRQIYRNDTGWPLIKIKVERGEIKDCEIKCRSKGCLHGIKIKRTTE